jgi:hypothetical protein
MLNNYIYATVHNSTRGILSNGRFYGEIPGVWGVYVNEQTLEARHEQLQDVLEEWIILGLCFGQSLPVVDRIDLAMHEEAV